LTIFLLVTRIQSLPFSYDQSLSWDDSSCVLPTVTSYSFFSELCRRTVKYHHYLILLLYTYQPVTLNCHSIESLISFICLLIIIIKTFNRGGLGQPEWIRTWGKVIFQAGSGIFISCPIHPGCPNPPLLTVHCEKHL